MPIAFPLEAVGAGIENGSVRAFVTINASREVTGVALLTVESVRASGRSVQLALRYWKFNTAAIGRAVDTDAGIKATN